MMTMTMAMAMADDDDDDDVFLITYLFIEFSSLVALVKSKLQLKYPNERN